jgi:hypothetical protein
VLHSCTAWFSHRPYHFAMSVYFSAIKRDLAILTEWWQQRIAWWELLNAAGQRAKLFAYVNNNIHDIKRILQDKQFHLQLKSEQKEIIQNLLERKDSMERACVTSPPLILDTVRSYPVYANHLSWYIAVIVVFSKSRDKWLKNKLTWRNDRVYVKIVLYSSVTPLSEGKMVMNE